MRFFELEGGFSGAAAQTGQKELDGLIGIAGKSPYNLTAVVKRWGMQGVNYVGNLVLAGRGDLASAITAMPTYAKSVIVAENNMRTFGLNDNAITAQENALKADLKNPMAVYSAKQIAYGQAVEARKAELYAIAAPGDQADLVKKLNEAGKAVHQSKSALDRAVRNEQAMRNALQNAQDAFRKNMADENATEALAAAIEQLQKATAARTQAQRALSLNQQTMSDARQKLAEAQKQATAKVDEQAKQDVDGIRLGFEENKGKQTEAAEGQEGEQGNGLPVPGQAENVSSEGGILAQTDGSSIIKENVQKFGPGSADVQKTAETNQVLPPLGKQMLLEQKAEGKNGAINSGLLAASVSENTVPSGLQKIDAETLPNKVNRSVRALASAGAMTDVGYRDSQVSGESSSSASKKGSNSKGGKYGDVEVYWKDIQPTQNPTASPVSPTPTPAPSSTPTLTPSTTIEPKPTPAQTSSVPKYTVNVFKTGDYARNQNIYPGVTERTLMPLEYMKQAQAQLKQEGVIYPGDGIIYHFDPVLSFDEGQSNDTEQRKRQLETDCVGMIVLPAMMWYSDKMFKELKSGIWSKIKTNVEYTYTNSSHKGDFSKDFYENGKMFDGMQLISLDDKGKKAHIVTFYKEFVCDGVVYKDVVVDISGDKYDKDPFTHKPIIDSSKKDNNEHTEVRIRSFEEACENVTYEYWCAPDYIDYGDQTDPYGNLLTPKKQWDERKKI